MIARLAVELHCYIPEELDETWAHLRPPGVLTGPGAFMLAPSSTPARPA